MPKQYGGEVSVLKECNWLEDSMCNVKKIIRKGEWEMNKDIQFLKELQQELKTQETDGNASPRFWVIKDYRMVPASEKYDSGEDERFFNDGDHVTFISLVI